MIKKTWNSLIGRPDLLFLLFASIFGLIFVFLIPPLGGSDEGFQYQKVASIAYFEPLMKPVAVPATTADFIKSGHDFFHEGLQPPFHYPPEQWHKMAAFGDAPDKKILYPSYLTQHDPVSYIPQVLIFRLGVLAGLTPLYIMYGIRLAGLASGICLIFMAIRRIPSHKYALCALALLPTITIYRSCISADVFTVGMAFFFTACILYEIQDLGIISHRNLVMLAILAFILAQCKNCYLFLLLMTFAIPGNRFSGKFSRILSLAIIILPGTIASLAWMVTVKYTFFKGLSYHTWGGDAYPDMQSDYTLHHPFDYLQIYLRTLFMTPLLPMIFAQITGDTGPGHYLPFPVIIALLYLLAAVIATDTTRNIQYGKPTLWLAVVIILMEMVVIPSMLYIHWTGVASPQIMGFNGRYLYPVLPLFLLWLKAPKQSLFSLKPGTYITLLASCGLVATLWRVAENYY